MGDAYCTKHGSYDYRRVFTAPAVSKLLMTCEECDKELEGKEITCPHCNKAFQTGARAVSTKGVEDISPEEKAEERVAEEPVVEEPVEALSKSQEKRLAVQKKGKKSKKSKKGKKSKVRKLVEKGVERVKGLSRDDSKETADALAVAGSGFGSDDYEEPDPPSGDLKHNRTETE
jgi:hypothetical protein